MVEEEKPVEEEKKGGFFSGFSAPKMPDGEMNKLYHCCIILKKVIRPR